MKKLVCTFYILVSVSIVYAQVLFDKEFQINSTTLGRQRKPDIARLPHDNFVVCWESKVEGNGVDIVAQIFNADGSKLGSEFIVNQEREGDQLSPQVTALSDRFVVAWYSDDWAHEGLYYRMFDLNGNPMSSDTALQMNPWDFHGRIYRDMLSLSTLKDGKRFVVSCFRNGQAGSLVAKIIDITGAHPVKNIAINRNSYNTVGYPDIEPLDNGGFVICYYGKIQGIQYAIWFQLFDSTGNYIGEEVRVDSAERKYQWDPTIETTDEGRMIICWESCTEDGYDDNVKCRIYAQDGSPLTNEFMVNSHTKHCQEYPSIVALNNNYFFVTWSSKWQAGTDYDIYGQLFSMDGSKFGAEMLLNDHIPCAQKHSRVTLINNKSFLLAFDAACYDGSEEAIFGKVLPVSPQKHALVPFSITTPTHDSSVDSTRIQVTWQSASDKRVIYPCELVYTLQYSLDSNFADFGTIRTVEPKAHLVGLKKGKLYYIKVDAQNLAKEIRAGSNTIAVFVRHGAVGESDSSYQFIDETGGLNCEWSADISRVDGSDNEDNDENSSTIPDNYLLKNAPNPFNSTTMIQYAIPQSGAVKISLYDTRGRKVRTLLNETNSAGRYSTLWDGYFDDGSIAPSGIYFYKMSFVSAAGAKQNIVKKMSLVR